LKAVSLWLSFNVDDIVFELDICIKNGAINEVALMP